MFDVTLVVTFAPFRFQTMGSNFDLSHLFHLPLLGSNRIQTGTTETNFFRLTVPSVLRAAISSLRATVSDIDCMAPLLRCLPE